MEIISHRGYWFNKKEQNTLAAYKRALDHGFGIELDIRDYNGKIIVSHDLPGPRAAAFCDIFNALKKHKNFKKVFYAINIKSDGLEEKINGLIAGFGIRNNSFVFDMSITSMFTFSKFPRGAAIATRISDIEGSACLYEQAEWVWLDEFKRHWISNEAILKHIKNNKSVCIVSPELHKRPYLKIWQQYFKIPKRHLSRVAICTDLPQPADKLFNKEGKA